MHVDNNQFISYVVIQEADISVLFRNGNMNIYELSANVFSPIFKFSRYFRHNYLAKPEQYPAISQATRRYALCISIHIFEWPDEYLGIAQIYPNNHAKRTQS